MPAPNTHAEPAPKISGVTTQAREAREAAMQEPSDQTLSIMPSLGDLAEELGIKEGRPATPTGETEEKPEEEAETDDTADDATPDEQEEPEASADGETEPTEDAEPESEDTLDEEGDAAAIKAGMQKRIDKLTAQRTDLQTQLDTLQAELETAKAGPPPAPSADNPLGHIHTEAALDAEIQEARSVKQWCLRNRHGGELPGKDGNPRVFDADEVATMLANAEGQLDAAPARREWLGHVAASQEMGRKLAPIFYQKGSEHQQVLAKLMATVPPAVKAWRPDIELLLIQALIGSSIMAQQAAPAAGKGKPQVSAKAAPSAPGGRVAPKAPLRQVQTQQKQKQFVASHHGSERELADLLEARLG